MVTTRTKARILGVVSALLIGALASLPASGAPPQRASPRQLDQATYLTWFGERPIFSPDGKRIAFVDKQFGQAFEIDIASRKVRSLTAHLPHQGIIRVQYLANGDYLITAPRLYSGPETRFRGAGLWVLGRSLDQGLMPLDQLVMEGVAVSSLANRIVFAEPPEPNGETEFYAAEIAYPGGVPRLANKRRIVRESGCVGEPQDFRRGDREVTYTCYRRRQEGQGEQAGVYGVDIASGKVTRYRDIDTEYNEVEGSAPDGSWTTVECGGRITASAPRLDLCRLELAPDGANSVLLSGTLGNVRRKASNPVISPDGKWMAFSVSEMIPGADPRDAARSVGILLLSLTQ